MTEGRPVSPASSIDYSRQRLIGFDILHASQIKDELGRIARNIDPDSFRNQRIASTRTRRLGRARSRIGYASNSLAKSRRYA